MNLDDTVSITPAGRRILAAANRRRKQVKGLVGIDTELVFSAMNRKVLEADPADKLRVRTIVTFRGQRLNQVGRSIPAGLLWRAFNQNCYRTGSRTTCRTHYPEALVLKETERVVAVKFSDFNRDRPADQPIADDFYVALIGVPVEFDTNAIRFDLKVTITASLAA